MPPDAEPRVPVTYEHHDHVTGQFLHGTKAQVAPGEELVPGWSSNFDEGRVMNHIYFTTLESTAAWGAQPEALQGMLESLAALRAQGLDVIED